MLDRDTVLEIRQRYNLGYPVKEIAKGFGVSQTTVTNIGRGHTHKRVKRGTPSSRYPIRQRAPRDNEKAIRSFERARRNRQNH